MKYSEEDREMAAVICSIAACENQPCYRLGILGAAEETGATPQAAILAWKAFIASDEPGYIYAEAEAMIRTGWSP